MKSPFSITSWPPTRVLRHQNHQISREHSCKTSSKGLPVHKPFFTDSVSSPGFLGAYRRLPDFISEPGPNRTTGARVSGSGVYGPQAPPAARVSLSLNHAQLTSARRESFLADTLPAAQDTAEAMDPPNHHTTTTSGPHRPSCIKTWHKLQLEAAKLLSNPTRYLKIPEHL